MVRTRLNIGCRYSTPVRERPLHPTRGHFTPEPSQTQAPVTPATEPERRAGGSLTTIIVRCTVSRRSIARSGLDLDRSTLARLGRQGLVPPEAGRRPVGGASETVLEAVHGRDAGAGARSGPRQDEDRPGCGRSPATTAPGAGPTRQAVRSGGGHVRCVPSCLGEKCGPRFTLTLPGHLHPSHPNLGT